MHISTLTFTSILLSLVGLTAAKSVKLEWEDGGWGFARFRSASAPTINKSALQLTVQDDGTVYQGTNFEVDLKKINSGVTTVKCSIVGKLNKEETTFKFKDGTNFLSHCNLQDGIAVVCEDPVKADCKSW